jgi:hypothetical protein
MMVAVALLLALGAMFYTLFVRPRDVPEPLPVSPIQHLEDRKYAIYDNLRDLQFEYRLGKLSDDDYQQTKQALQRELAIVLAETEETVKRLGLARAAAPKRKQQGSVCPHCRATFAQNLKFCGECGKAMA